MTGNDAFTKILLHFDGTNGSTTITDNNVGGSAHVWTANGATIDTSQSKFGGASLNCGAAAGYVATPDSTDFTLGSGDFTIDCWFNSNGGTGGRSLCAQNLAAGGARAFACALNGSNVIIGTVTSDGSTNNIIFGTTAISSPGWHHYAFVRTGNILRLFLDGVQEGSDLAFSATVFNSSAKLTVGVQDEGAFGLWNGWIDEFRLSIGIARWTANFTPPTSAYGVLNLGLMGAG